MDVLLVSDDLPPGSVLPALGMLPFTIRVAASSAGSVPAVDGVDLVVVDARQDLTDARSMCQQLGAHGLGLRVLAVVAEGGLVAVGPEWGVGDIVLSSAGAAEVHARCRLLIGRRVSSPMAVAIRLGELTIEEDTYLVRLRDRPLELAYREFELLRFLALHPGRVFSRQQLLSEVWGFDFFGGTRTVDVHVRRLRAKFGTDHQGMIETVRGMGYRVVAASRASPRPDRRPRTVQDGDLSPATRW